MSARGKLQTLEIVPDPVALMESMRAVGYTAESAIADLLDNSISARAGSIEVQYDATSEPYVAILDDGHGMSAAALTSAMRHGSRNPSEVRDARDLGRFGLGLKTASLSQCRRFTVLSKQDGIVSARRWDLEVVQATGRWLVVVPSAEEITRLPLSGRLASQASGTLVVWQSLDRLAAGSDDVLREMTVKFSGLREHLALVFHRFTEREGDEPAVSIRVNGLPLPRRDPFIRGNSYGQPLEGQTIRHQRGVVTVTPFVLPPISHLGPDEIELAGGREGLRGTQGFYVYRNRRLVIWGTWFRLVPKHEFFKLTRVQVDIPNTFDELWSLDIKKSAAQPPEFIRSRLKELIPHFASASQRTITYPGRKTNNRGSHVPLWLRSEPRHGTFRYDVNTEHPAIQAFASALTEQDRGNLAALLELISLAVPLEGIYADMCTDGRDAKDDAVLTPLLELGRRIMDVTGLSAADVLALDPFIRYPDARDRLLQEMPR